MAKAQMVASKEWGGKARKADKAAKKADKKAALREARSEA